MTEYRIDDLARAAGTTSRNVRAYQERGLLPPPQKRGRVGIYGDAHLTRLKLIDTLLQRGFTTAHIDDFITGWEDGKDLTEVLGLQHAVTEPWSQTETVSVSTDLVHDFLGDRDDTQLERLIELGLARIEGETCVFTDPTLFRGFAELTEFGFTLRQLVDIHERLHRAVDAIAKDLIRSAETHIVDQHGSGWLPEGDEVGRTAEMLHKMREHGVASVHSTLARALDVNLQRELGDYLAAAIDSRSNETS
ncbi:MerR family transcriptional regulator [Rhodococcus erythropolis]|uniref:MerR family transcriptional regulator n=1 Tax=Rhodococcus erythropolis TaxID=1833 RepID=UPI001BE7EAF2|nr:MerR family transcriptional regulator [Rhodococcus erythropolis]MBT2269840.1 MerR family transcriptional regulator [Rhodococcus erythropolis]